MDQQRDGNDQSVHGSQQKGKISSPIILLILIVLGLISAYISYNFRQRGIKLAKLEYEPKELVKFFLPKEDKNIPIPKTGIVPEFDSSFITEIKIPFGKRDIIIPLLKSKGFNVVG